ncbi:MAG: hypothetical protein ACK4UV_11505, partial [Ignavibacterium sp.]
MNGTAILKMITAQNKLYLITSNKLFEFDNSSLSELFTSSSSLSGLFHSGNYGLLLATSNGIYSLNENKFYFPNGPVANQFPQLSVDINSNLWSSTGTDVTGKGIQKFDGSKWTV